MVNPLMNKNVVLSLACQHKIVTGQGVSLHLMAKWLQCSKPTAKQTIKAMGIMEEKREYYRANVQKIVYVPTQQEFERYYAGKFRDDYLMYQGHLLGEWS